jgi:hypothetical protein
MRGPSPSRSRVLARAKTMSDRRIHKPGLRILQANANEYRNGLLWEAGGSVYDTTIHRKSLARLFRTSDFPRPNPPNLAQLKSNVLDDAVRLAQNGFGPVALRRGAIGGKAVFQQTCPSCYRQRQACHGGKAVGPRKHYTVFASPRI